MPTPRFIRTVRRPIAAVRPRRGGAFTLVELLVAIAVVAFLMVGVGQIFRSVGDLTSTGTALAEVEQMARAIERQMRDDFEALSSMAPDQTFIAIRMREVGDTNRNKRLDADEIAVYLTQEDRDADGRDIGDGVIDGPYDEGSRAVTVRLDEIAFLAAPLNGGFESYEQGEFGGTGVIASEARIYYGHGLRPPRDPNWPPEDPDDPASPRVPQRLYFPDGDFAQGPGQLANDPNDAENRFVRDLGGEYSAGGFDTGDFMNATGRNEFAGSWALTRQALLLGGGDVAGPQDTALAPAAVGNSREHAPYIRDLETLDRFWGFAGLGPYNFGLDHVGPRSGRYDARNVSETFPSAPRLIQHGRVDICAQGLRDVRRWLEGEPWPDTGATTPLAIDQQVSAPFESGRFSSAASEDGYATNIGFTDSAFNNPTRGPRAALWQRPDPSGSAPTPYLQTREGVRAAIAGAMTRLLVEDDPVFYDRSRDQEAVTYPIRNFETPNDPVDAFMDQHAILSSRCSNFEIAWRLADPDWPRVTHRDGIDFDNDGTPELREGDPVWIDITPMNPAQFGAGVDDVRSTVRNWLFELDPNGRLTGAPPAFGAQPSNNGGFSAEQLASEQPELGYDDWRNPDGDQLATGEFANAVIEFGETASPGVGSGSPNGWPGAYNPDLTMGAPPGQKEYLAIWPFHAASVSGDGYTETPFPKKIQIRVRMTLHDEQNRLAGGKTFEFIFDVAPGG